MLFTIVDTEKPNVNHRIELLEITQITCYQKVHNPHTFIVARIKRKKRGSEKIIKYKMEFSIEGKVTIDVTVSVHADDEKSAIELAKNAINDYYHLDYAKYHKPNEVKYDLDCFNEADYQDE